ncbi:hypothetical protein LXL04_014139 [Taraxacum kok-saghyz]
MSISIEALAMAGVDYNEWGMDFEEWERMQEMGPPPPHLYSEDYEEDERVEGGVMMMPKSTVDDLCGFTTAIENQLDNVFDNRTINGDDEFQIPLAKDYRKFVMGGYGIRRLKVLVVVLMVIRFLRRQILSTM